MLHLEQWLQDRVMAAKDPLVPLSRTSNNEKHTIVATIKAHEICLLCGGEHRLYKYSSYNKNIRKAPLRSC